MYFGKQAQVESTLLPIGTVINIVLTLSTWYYNDVYKTFNVSKSDEPVPSLTIDGISTITNDNYQSTDILLTLNIEFENSCVLNETGNKTLEYSLKWTIVESLQLLTDSQTDDIISFDSSDLTLTIDKSKLNPGNNYQFSVTMECTNDYSCYLSKSHDLFYDFSDLVCQIANGNKQITGVSEQLLKDYSFQFDGDTFSYDPDLTQSIEYEWNCIKYITKTDAASEIIIEYNVLNCSETVLSAIDIANPYVSLENESFESNTTYEYVFTMTMFDSEHWDVRDACVTSSLLTITDVATPKDGSGYDIVILDVSISAASTSININDKLRLIASVNSEDSNIDTYTFEWEELNGLLTHQDILDFQINDDSDVFDSNYLIFDSNVLEQGRTYYFQVSASKYDGSKLTEFGSASIAIYVNNGPSIVDNSFAISDSVCNGETFVYSSFLDVFNTFYDISIEANGDNTPLYYQFSLNHTSNQHLNWLLDASTSENAFMDEVILPVGEYSVQVFVTDAQGSVVSEIVGYCSFEIDSNSDCSDLETEIIGQYLESNPLLSKNNKYLYLFQSLQVTLLYLMSNASDDQTNDCSYKLFVGSINVMNDYFGNFSDSDGNDFCDRAYVLQLNQIVSSWLLILEKNRDWAYELLTSDLANVVMIFNIMERVLDPCLFVANEIDGSIEDLYNVADSIITQTVAIYYNSNDVTNQLSYLLTDLDYTSEFYYLIEQMISVSGVLYQYPHWNNSDIASTTTSNRRVTRRRLQQSQYETGSISPSLITVDMLSLITNSLYINELASLSVSIPTEEYTFDLSNFGVYIARINNETVNTTIGNVTIIIGDDDTDDGRDDFKNTSNSFDSVDVIVYVIDSSDTNTNVSYIGSASSTNTNSHACKNINNNDNNNGGIQSGSAHNDEVSITIISSQNSTDFYNLTGNVTIIFENIWLDPNISDNATVVQLCVWYNVSADLWSTEGCTSYYDEESRTVTCNCNHLTTFTVLSTIADDSDDGDSKNDCSDVFDLTDYSGALLTFIICLFLFILLFIAYKFFVLVRLKLFLSKYKQRRESYKGLFFCAICCVVQVIDCDLLLIYYSDNYDWGANDAFIKLLIIFGSLPYLIYFWMFTQSLKGWITVAHSLDVKLPHRERRIRLYFTVANTIVSLLFLVIVFSILCDWHEYIRISINNTENNLDLFLYLEILWFCVVTIACIFFTYYGLKVHRVLDKTLLVVFNAQDQAEIDKQKAVVNRLTVISVILCMFYFLQSLIALYGVLTQVTSIQYDFVLVLLNLYLNVMYLIAFLFLYVPQINSVIRYQKYSQSSDRTLQRHRSSGFISTEDKNKNKRNSRSRVRTHSGENEKIEVARSPHAISALKQSSNDAKRYVRHHRHHRRHRNPHNRTYHARDASEPSPNFNGQHSSDGMDMSSGSSAPESQEMFGNYNDHRRSSLPGHPTALHQLRSDSGTNIPQSTNDHDAGSSRINMYSVPSGQPVLLLRNSSTGNSGSMIGAPISNSQFGGGYDGNVARQISGLSVSSVYQNGSYNNRHNNGYLAKNTSHLPQFSDSNHLHSISNIKSTSTTPKIGDDANIHNHNDHDHGHIRGKESTATGTGTESDGFDIDESSTPNTPRFTPRFTPKGDSLNLVGNTSWNLSQKNVPSMSSLNSIVEMQLQPKNGQKFSQMGSRIPTISSDTGSIILPPVDFVEDTNSKHPSRSGRNDQVVQSRVYPKDLQAKQYPTKSGSFRTAIKTFSNISLNSLLKQSDANNNDNNDNKNNKGKSETKDEESENEEKRHKHRKRNKKKKKKKKRKKQKEKKGHKSNLDGPLKLKSLSLTKANTQSFGDNENVRDDEKENTDINTSMKNIDQVVMTNYQKYANDCNHQSDENENEAIGHGVTITDFDEQQYHTDVAIPPAKVRIQLENVDETQEQGKMLKICKSNQSTGNNSDGSQIESRPRNSKPETVM